MYKQQTFKGDQLQFDDGGKADELPKLIQAAKAERLLDVMKERGNDDHVGERSGSFNGYQAYQKLL